MALPIRRLRSLGIIKRKLLAQVTAGFKFFFKSFHGKLPGRYPFETTAGSLLEREEVREK
jgi:hypothetical protein